MRLIFLFLLLPLFGKSQNDTTKYYKSLDYGWNYQRLKARAAMVLPSDTVTNKLGIVTIDTSVFVGNGIRWAKVGGATGSTIDTTSLSNRINTKLSISDSATYYTKYRSDTSRTNIYAAIDATSDTASVVKATVHNAEATTLTKGTVVYLYGSSGNVASVKKAYNTSDTFSSKTFAIVKEDIASGQRGIVITQGVVDKLNLGSFNEGDIVWLDSIPGQFTKTKPFAPYHQVFVGVVERANNGNGQLFVKVQNGYELGELHNVNVNGQSDNDVLYYQSSTKLWKAKSPYLLVDTSSLSNRINVKLNASDTTSLSNRINTKLNSADTSSLSNRINTKVNLSDSTIYQTKFRSDTARTNTYTAISGKFTLPSLTSGSILFSNGITIAQKNANLFWDNTTNRLGLGTASPSYTLDVQGSIANTTGNIVVMKNTNSSLTSSPILALDCSATGADQPVDIRLGSTNPKGLRIYASNTDLGASPAGAGFQFFSTSSSNFPGQIYFDAGANNSGGIIFRTAQTSGNITQRMRIFANGNVSISSSATDPGYLFNVNGSARVTSLFYSALSTTPSSASAAGTQGEVRIDANYIYVCTATNTWKRAAISTW